MEDKMGLWSFVKDAGKSLWGGDDDTQATDALNKEISDLGLDSDGLDVKVEGDVVKMSGTAISQEIKEKIMMAVGNVAGISSVDDSSTGDDPVFHEVKKGDTLWAISEAALGNGARYKEIFEANRPMLSDPDKIYPGQMLRIPQDASA